jgi:hypothetical protein
VDPGPDPLLLRKSDRARNRTRTSGYVVRNSGYRGGSETSVMELRVCAPYLTNYYYTHTNSIGYRSLPEEYRNVFLSTSVFSSISSVSRSVTETAAVPDYQLL